MSTPRHIRKARRSDPWAPTVRGDLDELPLIEWRPSLPVGEATELQFEEGMQQFRLAERLREDKLSQAGQALIAPTPTATMWRPASCPGSTCAGP